MAEPTKFLFNRNFDDEGPMAEEKEQEETKAEEAEQEAEVPTFSEEDLKVAREEGFTSGKEMGIREAADATERQAAEALTAISGRLSELFRIQELANETTEHDAISVAASIARKVLPGLYRHHAYSEVERFVETAMELLRDEPRVTIRINEELREPLARRMEAITAAGGFEGRLVLLAEADISPGDCKIEWTNGGGERSEAALWKEIDAIIERNLGTPPADAAGEVDAGEGAGEGVEKTADEEKPAPMADNGGAGNSVASIDETDEEETNRAPAPTEDGVSREEPAGGKGG